MADKDDFHELPPGEKLKAGNELLKLKLQAEFGMGKLDSSLNAAAENEWLNYIYGFEKQFAENKQCKVYDFIGCPEFRKGDELSKKEISKALERLTEIMKSNGIELSTICDYEDEVIYRFITEELFEHEMDDMRIPGMMHCFTYEEFHPNHDYDIREHSNEFIKLLISKKWDDFMNNILLAKTVSYNDNQYDKKTFPKIIEAFQTEHQKMKLLKWKINSVNFDLKTGTAWLKGYIHYKTVKAECIFGGEVQLELTMEYDYWSINKVVVPGFSKEMK